MSKAAFSSITGGRRRVNVYRLGDYDDYFYGYMVMSIPVSQIF